MLSAEECEARGDDTIDAIDISTHIVPALTGELQGEYREWMVLAARRANPEREWTDE